MSSASANSKGTVLVTGINGFAGSSIALAYLEAGYRVRGTVRSSAKAETWKAKHPIYNDSLEFVTVPDILADGAFDEAIKGVDFVAHAASPVIVGPTSKDLPYTVNALKAAHGEPSVRRFVLLSSVASIRNPFEGDRPGYVYTEKDWNPVTYEQAASFDATKGSGFVYAASKALAERSAWDFMKENNPKFSLTAINPSLIFGPPEFPASSLKELTQSSLGMVVQVLTSGGEVGPTFSWAILIYSEGVDLRDVAEAHVKAIEVEASKGQRYLVSGFHFSNSKTATFLRSAYPDHAHHISKPNTTDKSESEVYGYDNSKSKRELGLEYRSFEQSMRAFADRILSFL